MFSYLNLTQTKLRLYTLLIFLLFLILPNLAFAKENSPEILFIPQDNRPISAQQTAAIMESAGYKVSMPPENILGNRSTPANTAALFNWLKQHGGNNKIAVVASDSLIYGGLVSSRKHGFTLPELSKQVQRLQALHKEFPHMPIYVFASIMRTPRDGNSSGTEDANYYQKYGALIANYSKIDGADTSGLAKPYQIMLRQEEAQSAIKDWQQRRLINFNINKQLLELTKNGVITYLLLGRDDNEANSPTDKEGKALKDYAKFLGLTQDQAKIISGIDELALLTLSRIAVEKRGYSPNIYVEYALGFGPATIPTYSNEAIDSSITDEIYALHARRVFSPKEADLVFLINTNQSGWTYDANTPINTTKQRFNSADFLQRIAFYLDHNKPVAIGDIAFANGSDNALMEAMHKYHLLERLYGYAGWNTATNSTGFALGMGLIALDLPPKQRRGNLATRYMDDWLYQANIRQDMNSYLSLLPGSGDYLDIGKIKMEPVTTYGTKRLNLLVNKYLENFPSCQNHRITLPWNRLFEADFPTTTSQQIFPWHS